LDKRLIAQIQAVQTTLTEMDERLSFQIAELEQRLEQYQREVEELKSRRIVTPS
jgi:hypothetical protein